jgi:hypothetical protein
MQGLARVTLAALALVLAGAASARADDIDNPKYKQWSRFKVGSFVTMKMVVETGGNKTELENTTTLVELTAEKAVVEMKGKMALGAYKIDIPANKLEIPARIHKPEAGSGDAKPAEGTEEVEVGGKKVSSRTAESSSEADGTKKHVKVWLSDEIPGGVAKTEQTAEGALKSHMVASAERWEAK